MPIYEYSCSQCGKLHDVLQKISDPPPTACEACGAQDTLSRVVSRTSFVLKGGGWYADLYGSSKKGESGGAGDNKAKKPDTSGGESKPKPDLGSASPPASGGTSGASAPTPAASSAGSGGGGDTKK
jgi:putative FmdB family regulatory protein